MSAVDVRDLITYVESSSLEWEEVAPGARRKTILDDPATGRRVRLVQWDAGYSVPALDQHPYGEYLYILDGTFVDHNRESGPGTYIHNFPGSAHQPSTPTGCTFFVIVEGRPNPA